MFLFFVKIGKEFPYIQKVEKLVRKSPINFQNRNCQNFKKKVISGTIPRNEHFVLKFSFHRRSEILPDDGRDTATFFSSASALTSTDWSKWSEKIKK